MQNVPCNVFNSSNSVITQLHYVVFIMLKPACIRLHLSCCLVTCTQSALAYYTTFLREKEQNQPAERFKQTVNDARDAICAMLNQVYAYRQTGGICAQSMELYLQCTRQLQEVLDEIEHCWAGHCTQQCHIPDEYLHQIRPLLQKRFNSFKSLLFKTEVSQELAVIIAEPVSEFIAMQHARCITIHDMIYMEKLLTVLEEWGDSGPLTEERLSSLLLELNFNGKAFTEYHYRLLQRRLLKAATIQEKMEMLEEVVNNWYGYMLAAKPGRIFAEPSVVEVLIEWVIYQWYGQQQLLQNTDAGEEARPNSHKQGKGTYKMQFGDEPAVISGVIHLMHDTGMYEGSLKDLFEYLAENAEFPNNKNVKADYLMRAGKKYKKKADESLLLNYLPKWYQLSGGRMPGKRT